MCEMRFNPRALLVLLAVMTMLWLAVEGDVALAGIALDGVLGWGLLGFSIWVFLVRGPGQIRRLLHARHDRRPW
jgi:hypothetical protein